MQRSSYISTVSSLLDDANKTSKAYIDLHASINDWGEMGTSMGAVWQTVNQRNVQAAKDGLITWEDYFDTRLDYTEQFLDSYLAYSDDWVENEQEYNNMSAADTIAAVNRQRKEVEEYFAGLGELTDEEKVVRIKVEAELDKKMYDAVRDKLSEWEDDADWYEKQAGVYGWDFMHDDSATDFYQRKIENTSKMVSKMKAWTLTKQQYARRQADEMRLEFIQSHRGSDMTKCWIWLKNVWTRSRTCSMTSCQLWKNPGKWKTGQKIRLKPCQILRNIRMLSR